MIYTRTVISSVLLIKDAISSIKSQGFRISAIWCNLPNVCDKGLIVKDLADMRAGSSSIRVSTNGTPNVDQDVGMDSTSLFAINIIASISIGSATHLIPTREDGSKVDNPV